MTRVSSSRNRSVRPGTENLEDRRLLSAAVSGTDIDGDTWTLRLIGPGSLVVTKQNDTTGSPAALNSNTEINTITVSGTNPRQSRIVGTVHKGANGNGIVFFQNLTELSSKSERLSGGQGLVAINMPNFWQGNTTPISGGTQPTAGTIAIPDGVDTLRFGGVDTTHNQNPNLTSASNPTSDRTEVVIGSPEYGGVRVIIHKSVSSTQSVPAASTTTQPTIIQHGVNFAVSGRLDLFQADSIEGDPANPPGQFNDVNPPSNGSGITASGTGGTSVVSGTGGVAPFFPNTVQNIAGGAALTGQIGNIRIGGNATNFSTAVFDTTGTGNARITNYSVGGETNNVLVIAPNGMRTATFGHGMDKVDLATHVLNTLQANRGAVDSNVYVDRTISRVTFGGDVVDTNVLTGVLQNYSNIFNTVTGTSTNPLASASPSSVPVPANAQTGGGMQVLVAGSITSSVFSASVQPFNGMYGTTNDVVDPTGHISAKVEGTIDNSAATNVSPDTPTKAFFAQRVDLKHGPVVPPNVPQAPYTGPAQPTHAPGIPNLNASAGVTSQASSSAVRTLSARHAAAQSTTLSKNGSTPKGPAHPTKSGTKA